MVAEPNRFARMPGKPPDTIVHQEAPLNAEPPREALAGAPITPIERFYVRNHGPVPENTGALRIDGLVRRPHELSLDDLRALPRRELTATLQCAGNRRADLLTWRDIPGEAPWGPGATGTARWAGAALADVLALAGVDRAAAYVGLTGADHAEEADPPQNYEISIPLAKAIAPEVLLAWEMNGAPLEPVHGAPLRAIVPGYIGARSVKWLERIELRAEPSDGYYQATAYRMLPEDGEPARGAGFPLGEVALNSDFLSARCDDGRAELEGYAFAGGARCVERVEVSVAGGHWAEAELLEDQGEWAWRLWRATVELPPGRHELRVRAWDSAGATQPETPAAVWNPKGYANSAWGRIEVTIA
jgi:sulfite oxidase